MKADNIRSSDKPTPSCKKMPAYSRRRKHDRTTVIYGVCVHKTEDRHYCFNREYGVLPVELPKAALEAIINSAKDGSNVGQYCGGGGMPEDVGDLNDWNTYVVFRDVSAPEWE